MIVNIMLSLIVLGGCISKLTSTIAELSKKNSDVADTRRVLQRYLKASRAPLELSSRIITFALYSLKRKASVTLNQSVLELFSQQLSFELIEYQRSKHVLTHPLFKWADQCYVDVYSSAVR